MAACLGCNGPMKGSGERFCSFKCSVAARKRRLPQVQCRNPDCGEFFQPRARKSRFCSRACYRAAPQQVAALRATTLTACAGCGDPFVAMHSNHRYCSPKCRTEAASDRQRIVEVRCQRCGAVRMGAPRQRFCSRACYNAWRVEAGRVKVEARRRAAEEIGQLQPFQPPPNGCVHYWIQGATRYIHAGGDVHGVTDGTCSKCGAVARWVLKESELDRRPLLPRTRWNETERQPLNDIPHYV